MTDYDQIAPFYDIEHAHFDEDVSLYLNYAEMCSGPLLELACGSGRLLVPLASEGYDLTGVDSSKSMLDLARLTLEEAGLADQCTLVQENMCTMHLGRKFCLAFLALGSFAHVYKRQEQRQTLATVHDHLTVGSRFILDISNEDVRYMEHLSGQMLHQGTWKRKDGSLLSHVVSPAASQTKHLLELTHFYDEHRQGEAVRRTVTTTHLYLFEKNEVELLLEEASFEIIDVFGDYEMSPFELESPRMIFIAEAR